MPKEAMVDLTGGLAERYELKDSSHLRYLSLICWGESGGGGVDRAKGDGRVYASVLKNRFLTLLEIRGRDAPHTALSKLGRKYHHHLSLNVSSAQLWFFCVRWEVNLRHSALMAVCIKPPSVGAHTKPQTFSHRLTFFCSPS